jgi:hypothetical protein
VHGQRWRDPEDLLQTGNGNEPVPAQLLIDLELVGSQAYTLTSKKLPHSAATKEGLSHMSEFVIKDAESFYTIIKSNPLYKDKDDRGMIAALNDYYHGTLKIADARNVYGMDREEFLFFQGMLAGALVMSKIFRHHIITEASLNNVDPTTGKAYGDSH